MTHTQHGPWLSTIFGNETLGWCLFTRASSILLFNCLFILQLQSQCQTWLMGDIVHWIEVFKIWPQYYNLYRGTVKLGSLLSDHPLQFENGRNPQLGLSSLAEAGLHHGQNFCRKRFVLSYVGKDWKQNRCVKQSEGNPIFFDNLRSAILKEKVPPKLHSKNIYKDVKIFHMYTLNQQQQLLWPTAEAPKSAECPSRAIDFSWLQHVLRIN